MNKINISPSIWGKHAWIFLHSIALSYPINPTDKEKNEYKDFYYSLRNVLPCETCATHFTQNIKNHPIDLTGPHELFSWVVKIQNEVQKILKQPLVDELSLREKYYSQNESVGLYIPFKYKVIIFIIISIVSFYSISKILKIKVEKA